MISSGVDVITGGNHVFKRYEIRDVLKRHNNIIRPLNYPNRTTPGKGIYKFYCNNIKVCIINLLGVVYMESLNCPFETMDYALDQVKDCKIIIVDFHAEATAEKRALGFYLDGKISVLFGTHTHVQTSDESILPNGTGYITDVGMTGVINSVLGVKKEISIARLKNKLPIKFNNADGPCKMECIMFTIDDYTGKTVILKRLRVI